jgi:hypothetical protein
MNSDSFDDVAFILAHPVEQELIKFFHDLGDDRKAFEEEIVGFLKHPSATEDDFFDKIRLRGLDQYVDEKIQPILLAYIASEKIRFNQMLVQNEGVSIIAVNIAKTDGVSGYKRPGAGSFGTIMGELDEPR